MTAPTVLTIVLDAVGRDTLERYLLATTRERRFPNLEALGLGNVLHDQFHGVIAPAEADIALAAEPNSRWADSVMGHRELMGFVDPTDYTLFMDGFPQEYIDALERKIGRTILYNKRAGGGEAIKENHAEHKRTKGVVLYASMCDPIAQFAADESTIPGSELTNIGKLGFDLAQQMGIPITRTITRPYVVKGEEYVRTANRRDFVIQLPQGATTLIDIAREHGIRTISIGKCADVVNTTTWYEDRALAKSLPDDLRGLYTDGAKDKNPYSLFEALRALEEAKHVDNGTFIFCNLPDTYSFCGHKRKIEEALNSLDAFDRGLAMILPEMPSNGLILVTADHGMRDGGDYGYHSREAVPIIGKAMDGRLRNRVVVPSAIKTYAVLGDLVAQTFGIEQEYRERCGLRELLK